MGLVTPLQFSVTLFCVRVKTEKSLLLRGAGALCLPFQTESSPMKPHCQAWRRERREGAKATSATTLCLCLTGFISIVNFKNFHITRVRKDLHFTSQD